MEWLAWVIVGLAVMAACGRGCARGGSRGRLSGGGSAGGHIDAGGRESLPGARTVRRAGARAPESARIRREPGVAVSDGRPETPLETLQRRFVEDRIDIDEYERELDRLYALEAPRARD